MWKVLKYWHYWFTAANAKGHGIHSPFVFEQITQVLNDDRKFYSFVSIENIRKQILLAQKQQSNKQYSSLIAPKYGQLLFRLIHYWSPSTVLEVESPMGISTAYLASANVNNTIISMDASLEMEQIKRANLMSLGLQNIQLVSGDLNHVLSATLNKITKVDFALVNAQGNYIKTMDYFKQLLKKAHTGSLFVFCNMHSNQELEQVWEAIKLEKAVTVTIDLFYMGLIFFRKENRVKENFIIRF